MTDLAIVLLGIATSFIVAKMIWYIGDDEIERQKLERK